MKILTSCQFVEVTVEESIELKTVHEFIIKSTLLPIETNFKTSVDTVEEEFSSHLGYYIVELV